MQETSSLLGGGRGGGGKYTMRNTHTQSNSSWRSRLTSLLDVEKRIMAVGFLLCLSFSYTQVPMLYAFHVMACDEYYDHHAPFEGPEDRRCSIDAIAAETAKQFTITGMSTTFCGIVNLFLAGWTVKKIGPRAALMMQTFVPAIRVFVQIMGVVAGKGLGILIIQLSQVITVVGGPAGYVLVTNIIVGEIVEPSRRTAVFGKLQGALMLGQGIGYLAGGMIGDALGVRAPFDLAFYNFFLAGFFVWLALPYISPGDMNSSSSSSNNGKRRGKGKSTSTAKASSSGFFAPLKILSPQRVRTADGTIRKHYGVILLCAGIFIGVLATDYAPLLIQMYATAAFDFGQADNGWLMSEFALMRSIFLIVIFPRIISIGRMVWRMRAAPAKEFPPMSSSMSTSHTSSESPTSFATSATSASSASSSIVTVVPGDETLDEAGEAHRELGHFDLVFLRWSLVIDGAMTAVAALATEKWHIYLAAALLPFGSGSAPAAKGVITDMCAESQRADALNLVTLVESIARLSTQGLFGFIFSSLAGVGKAYATFYCNAAIAVVGMLILLCSQFPAHGSALVDTEKDEDEDEDEDEDRHGDTDEATGLLE